MARWPFLNLKRRQRQPFVKVRTRGLRIEPLEQRALLNAGGAANAWPGGTPPVEPAWFQRPVGVPALAGGTPAASVAPNVAAVSAQAGTASASANPAPTVVSTPPVQSDGWIVQLTPTAAQQAGSVTGAADVLGSANCGAEIVSGLGMEGLVLVVPQSGVDPKAVDALLSGNPNVAWFEPNAVVTVTQTPNDTYFPLQWDMQNTGQTGGTPGADINAPAAWDISTGSGQVVVAVIDTGVDYNHPDLYENIWINQAEIPATRMQNLVDVYHDGYISMRDLNNPINWGPYKIEPTNGVVTAANLLAPMQVDANGNDLGGGGWATAARRTATSTSPTISSAGTSSPAATTPWTITGTARTSPARSRPRATTAWALPAWTGRPRSCPWNSSIVAAGAGSPTPYRPSTTPR